MAPLTKEMADISAGEDILIKLERLIHTMEDPRFAKPPKWVLDIYKPAMEGAVSEIERLRSIELGVVV